MSRPGFLSCALCQSSMPLTARPMFSADVFLGGVFNVIDSRGWCTDPSEACYLSAIPQARNANCWYRRCNESARARIPALVSALDLDDTDTGPRPDDAFALDTVRAMYLARRTRDVVVPGPKGSNCTAVIERRTFAHRTRPSLLVTSLRITVPTSPSCAPGTIVALPLRTGGPTGGAVSPVDINFQNVNPPVKPPVNGSLRAMEGLTETAEMCGRTPYVSTCAPRTKVAVVWTHVPLLLKVIAGCVPPARGCTFRYIASHASSLNSTDPLADASAAYTAAASMSITALENDHQEGWRRLMNPAIGGARVTIQSNNLKLAQATAASLYGILSSVRAGWMHHGLAPGGLSTGGCTAELAQLTDMCDYMGHAFTSDTEQMQYPALAALYPGPARSVVAFREAGLGQAIAKAQSFGFAGAYFPWEAAQTGSDQLLITDRDQPSAEKHVAGDCWVSRAVMNHYLSTRDKVWLKTAGYPMSLEIARFFANRFVPCTGHLRLGKYCMNNVMGPENWNKQNNTCEIMACGALALRWALRASVITALPLPADATNWSTIADNVYIPYNTSFGGYTPAFDTYYLCNETGSQGPRGPCVLDTSSVQQLIYPLRFAASLGSKVAAALHGRAARNDIYLYDDYGVVHGNAIMYGTGFVVPYLLLGDEDRANSWFAKSMSRFVGGPFQCWYEDPELTVGAGGGGTPNFLTGAGGWLQVMVMGWAGLNWADEIGDDTGPSVLQLTPRIPANTTTLTVEGISFVGARLSLNISVGHAMLTLLSRGKQQVDVSFFPAILAHAEGLDVRNVQDDAIVPPVAITLAVGQGVRVALGKLLNVSVSNISVEHEWSQSLKTDDDVFQTTDVPTASAQPGQTIGTDNAQLLSFADGPAPTFPTSNARRCSGALSVFATFQEAEAAVLPAELTEEQAKANGSLAGDSTALTSWIFSLLLSRDTRLKTDDVSPFHQPSRPVPDSGDARSASPPAVRNASNECGVSVRDFGAIGDGVADDTDPIQAALNSGESVYIPQGTYLITSALLLNTTRQMVRGAGQQSVLLTTTDIETMYTNSQVAQITLADLRFLNTVPENITGPTHFQVHFGPATSSTDIRDCDFRTALTGHVVRTTHHAGVWFEGANLNNVWDCTFNQAHILMGSTDSTIRGGFVYSFSFQYAIQIASAGEVLVDAVRGILGGPDKGCIWIPKPSYINKIVNNYFGGSYKFMNTGNGITADQPEMLQIIGNTFHEIDGVGIHLTTPCRGNVISANSFWAGNAKQNDSTGLIAGKQDIYIESLLFGASGTNIIGNVFNRFLGPVEDGMPGIGKSHAIEFNLKAGTAGNIVTGNSVVGARYFAPAIVDPNIYDAVNNNIGSAFFGNWNPSDLSGANLAFTDVTCKYTRTPDLVTVWVSFSFPPTSSNARAMIGGLPFAPQPGMAGAAGSLTTDSPVVQKVELVPEERYFVMTNMTGAQQSNAACSGKRFSFTASYLSGPVRTIKD